MVTLYPFDNQHNDPQFTFEMRKVLWEMALKTYSYLNSKVSIPYESRLPDSPFLLS